MDKFIKLLDTAIDYVSHKLLDDTIIIRVMSNKTKLYYPYCRYRSSKRHISYEHSFQDFLIMGKKNRNII